MMVLACAVLASLEIVLTLIRGGQYFLSWYEVFAYASAATVVVSACVTLVWLVPRSVITRTHVRWPTSRLRWMAMGLGGMACAGMIADATAYVRLYQGWHIALCAGTVSCMALSAVCWEHASRTKVQVALPKFLLASVLGLSMTGALFALNTEPNASLVARDYAPLTGKWLRILQPVSAGEKPVANASRGSAPSPKVFANSPKHGLDLTKSNVLLITVDALRTDCLRAYGGKGISPELDALAEQGVVFERAYTPSPQTSYALTSILTGKYVRSLVRLGTRIDASVTLADSLTQANYQTAAFYPPAIFSVDAHHFKGLRARGFGFVYRKEQFSSAEARVEELEAFLKQADARPVFAWVHLLEPHEPYEPAKKFYRGNRPQDRYLAEVARADAAVGMLVERFRRYRSSMVLIVTSDHGEEFEEHGGRFHGTTLYDEQARVPLVWVLPEHAKSRLQQTASAMNHGQVVKEAPVETLDIPTTLLGALGLPADPRMAGDDWSAVLGGEAPKLPHAAYAETETLHMVFDGTYKAICMTGLVGCRLFDVSKDPYERHNLALAFPGKVQRLTEQLSAFFEQLPAREQLPWEDHAAWPKVLARAQLGDASAAPELLPLLKDKKDSVRASAVRALGQLTYQPARDALKMLSNQDPSMRVKAEAVLALVALGDHQLLSEVQKYLKHSEVVSASWGQGYQRRAALVLGEAGDPSGIKLLMAIVQDASEDIARRDAAVVILGNLRAKQAVPLLVNLLPDVHLRVHVVEALEHIGDARALPHLRNQLKKEPYPAARRALRHAIQTF